MKKINTLITIILALFIVSCATYKPKYKSEMTPQNDTSSEKEIETRFYLLGDAGVANSEKGGEAIKAFQKLIANDDTKDDYAIFLGDNIYPHGLPSEGEKGRDEAEKQLDVQINSVKNFKGKTLFIPGNHDWYSDGLKGLKRQEKYVEKALNDKDAFQPEKGCPVEKINVTDNIVLLVLDTQWYITDWDKHPTINDECEIKSREDFFLEIEGELKKNNEKTILVAMHHPAYTNGRHGGFYNLEKHIFPFDNKIPLPVLATLGVQIRTQGGVSPQDRYNVRYNELMLRLTTLAKGNDRLIFASGHEHALQYIEHEGIKQIISGSGSKSSASALGNDGLFSYGKQGLAVLDVYTDGSSNVKYYGATNGEPELLFSATVHEAAREYDVSGMPANFDSKTKISAYKKEATDKGNGYKWFWGDHYRYVYGTDIDVPVATLDTLMGGLTIDRKGGGHQTRSLRLVDKKGRNFALRGVKKSAVQYLQSVIFTENYLGEDFDNTVTEDIILDFYTASHPYATFVVSKLSDAIGVYHTNPQLLYVPKHKALGKYNEEFGNELYVIEERPDDGFLDVASFGNPDAIESSSDVLKKLRKDEKYQIDEAAFIKARLFDMVLGDWDRHQDQWRWSRFDISKDKVVYRPIPRDRDQAFSNYDGALLDCIKAIIPSAKQLQEYDEELRDIKWINAAGIKMDRNFTQNSTREEWLKQAEFIKQKLTDEKIDEAFTKLPKEVIDDTSENIKEKLKSRRNSVVDIASRYYDYLTKLVIITGTDKDDHFEITRGDGQTKISVARIKGGEVQEPYTERTVFSSETKEIWIYGLDDDDQFHVSGKGTKPIFIRIVGGQNNDVYTIKRGKKVKVFDHKSKPNTIVERGNATFKFNDIYSNNTFDFNKHISKVNAIVPSIGSNPDDGLKIGIQDTYTIKGFKSDPFHRKHVLKAQYYFATQGFDIKYNGEFANTFGTWNFILGAHFASENFTQNFFGFGNETLNKEDEFDLDYNRVKTGILSGKIGVVKTGHYGSRVAITGGVEKIEVEETEDRFIAEVFEGMPEIFDTKVFGNVNFSYEFSGFDNAASPTRGMFFKLNTGVSTNLDDTERTFGYVKPSVIFYNSLSRNRRLVLKTRAQGHFNIGESFEFYQAAVAGANTGLRGFRTQRFSGQSALALGADLNYNLIRFKTGLLPLELGIYGGYDYGRVWIDDEDSDTWHDSVGGGITINAVDAVSGQFGLFNSDDGIRFSFLLGISL